MRLLKLLAQKTNVILKKLWVLPEQVNSLALVVLRFAIPFPALLILLSSCVTRAQIDSLTWLNNTSAMIDLCNKTPELKDYGFYRKLNNGKIEFISFCSPNAYNMLSMTAADYENLLKGLVPK